MMPDHEVSPDDEEFEVDSATGQPVLVKSEQSTIRAYLRFTNKTSRPVDVFWRDFRGRRVFYIRLEPNTHHNMNSYISHPWVFFDSATRERFVVYNDKVFRAPQAIGGVAFRTNWNITVPVRSLRWSCMLCLATAIGDPARVKMLGLPNALNQELEKTVGILKETIQPRQSS